MTTTRMSSTPFSPGDLVSCSDSTREVSVGIVLDIRTLPGVFRGSGPGSEPAFEVDVLFDRLNSFLSIISEIQVADRARGSRVGTVLTVSDSIIKWLGGAVTTGEPG